MGRRRSSNSRQPNKKSRYSGNKAPKAPFRNRSNPRKGQLNSRMFREAPEEKQDLISQKFSPEQLSKFVSSTQKRLHKMLEEQEKKKEPEVPVFDEEAENKKEESDLLELKKFIENIPDRGYARAQAIKKLDILRAEFEKKEQEKQQRKELAAKAKKTTQNNEQSENKFKTPGGIVLDPWQHEAVSALLEGKNLIVDAPTSAGKTRVIEALLEHKLKEGVRLVYTCPVKSLSNDKYAEFCVKYGKDMVGINTGDFKENLKAPIILATLETYRNSLLGVEPNLRQMVVVYDEYHYLQDESRGSAWEESIILSPNHSQLILLSASVPNTKDFSQWIESLKEKPCHVVRVEKRPVPLVDCIYFPEKGWVLADELNLNSKELSQLRNDAKREKRKKTGDRRGNNANYQEAVQPIVDALKLNLGPVVAYAARRADTESLAHTFAKAMRGNRDDEYQEKLKKRLETLQGWEYVPKELRRMVSRQAIAYHHSGLIPPGRVAIETLLKEGWLKICTGTMGISLGVNFAVRSAFVFDETRPSEGGPTTYTNT